MEAVVLTKSVMKSHGRSGACTAVYDFESGKILRLVSNKNGSPIPEPYCQRYECMDIVDAKIMETCPRGPQQENVLVDLDSIRTVKRGCVPIVDLIALRRISDGDEPLFMDQTESRLMSVSMYHHSLEIIRVADLKLSNNFRKSTKASFTDCSGSTKQYRSYCVTDPKFILPRDYYGPKKIGNAYIVVCIPGVPADRSGRTFLNKGYKSIAAIYPD